MGIIVTQADHHFPWLCNMDLSAIPQPLLRPTTFMSQRTDIVHLSPKPMSLASASRTWNGCRLLINKRRVPQPWQQRQWLSQLSLNNRDANDLLATLRMSAWITRPTIIAVNSGGRSGNCSDIGLSSHIPYCPLGRFSSYVHDFRRTSHGKGMVLCNHF